MICKRKFGVRRVSISKRHFKDFSKKVFNLRIIKTASTTEDLQHKIGKAVARINLVSKKNDLQVEKDKNIFLGVHHISRFNKMVGSQIV